MFDIRYSNKFVESLVSYHGRNDIFDMRNTVKYTKIIPEKRVLHEKGSEHVRTALIASTDEVYQWLLSLKVNV